MPTTPFDAHPGEPDDARDDTRSDAPAERTALERSALERREEDHRRQLDERRRIRLAEIELRIRHLTAARFPDPRLGYPEPHVAAAQYDALGQRITAEIRAGCTRHRRLPWLVRQIPRLVAVIDGVVLFTFCAVIFNVPMQAPLSEPVRTLAAVLLAVLASGVAYTWLALTGERLNQFRGELGQVRWRLVCTTTRIMVAVSLVLVAALSALMYLRVLDEVLGIGEPAQTATAGPLASAFAVLSAIANLSVVAVHAFDGSPESELLRDLGRRLRRQQLAIQRRQREAMTVLGGEGAPAAAGEVRGGE